MRAKAPAIQPCLFNRSPGDIADMALHTVVTGIKAVAGGQPDYRHTYYYVKNGGRLTLAILVEKRGFDCEITVTSAGRDFEAVLGLLAIRLVHHLDIRSVMGIRSFRATVPVSFKVSPFLHTLPLPPTPDEPPTIPADIVAEIAYDDALQEALGQCGPSLSVTDCSGILATVDVRFMDPQQGPVEGQVVVSADERTRAALQGRVIVKVTMTGLVAILPGRFHDVLGELVFLEAFAAQHGLTFVHGPRGTDQSWEFLNTLPVPAR
jgi:hypothetical protein